MKPQSTAVSWRAQVQPSTGTSLNRDKGASRSNRNLSGTVLWGNWKKHFVISAACLCCLIEFAAAGSSGTSAPFATNTPAATNGPPGINSPVLTQTVAHASQSPAKESSAGNEKENTVLAKQSPSQGDSVIQNALMIFFGLAGLTSFILLVVFIREGNRVAFETHWGGIGGGMTGLSFSPALSCLLLTLFFSLLILMVSIGRSTSNISGVQEAGGGQKRVSDSTAK